MTTVTSRSPMTLAPGYLRTGQTGGSQTVVPPHSLSPLSPPSQKPRSSMVLLGQTVGTPMDSLRWQ